MSNDSDEKFPEFNGAWQMNLASFHHEPAFVPPVLKRLARDAETHGEFFHIVQVSAFGKSPHLLDVYLRFVNLDSAGAYEVSEGYERVSLVHAGFLPLSSFSFNHLSISVTPVASRRMLRSSWMVIG